MRHTTAPPDERGIKRRLSELETEGKLEQRQPCEPWNPCNVLLGSQYGDPRSAGSKEYVPILLLVTSNNTLEEKKCLKKDVKEDHELSR